MYKENKINGHKNDSRPVFVTRKPLTSTMSSNTRYYHLPCFVFSCIAIFCPTSQFHNVFYKNFTICGNKNDQNNYCIRTLIGVINQSVNELIFIKLTALDFNPCKGKICIFLLTHQKVYRKANYTSCLFFPQRERERERERERGDRPASLERLRMSSWIPSLPSVSFKCIAADATSSGVTFPS